MATTLPVAYAHTIEGFSKGSDQGGPYYHVTYRIANWSDTDKFINALLGFGTASGSGGSIAVTRGIPHQHPLSPNLVCVAARVVEGLGNPILNSSGYPNYDGGALIQAEYKSPPFDFSGGNLNNQIDPATPLNWCTQELSYSTEIFTVSSSDPTKPPAKIQVPITVMTLTFHKLPYLPMSTVRSLRGKVNSTTFLGAAAGLVLFKGADTHREFNTDGSVCQEVKLTFNERSSGYPWNSAPSKANPYTTPWPAVTDGNGNPPFATADLSPLIQF
jgi:hypothetical protein